MAHHWPGRKENRRIQHDQDTIKSDDDKKQQIHERPWVLKKLKWNARHSVYKSNDPINSLRRPKKNRDGSSMGARRPLDQQAGRFWVLARNGRHSVPNHDRSSIAGLLTFSHFCLLIWLSYFLNLFLIFSSILKLILPPFQLPPHHLLNFFLNI